MAARAPAYSVIVDGVDITAGVVARFVSMTLTIQRGDEADQLDLVLSDHDGLMAIPRRDAIISLALGWKGAALKSMGTFKVDEVEWKSAPGLITVRARSADFTADMRIRRERSWRSTSLGAVLGDIAGAAGLSTRIAPQLASKPIAVLAQSRESDLALLQRLGREYDAVATVKAGAMIFAPIGSGTTATGRALAEVALTPAEGDSATWKAASRGEYAGVTASWHDPGSATRHHVTAGEAKGARRLKKTFASEADARREADSEWTRTQRGAGSLDFTLAMGRADLYPECRVRFTGLKPSIDATTWLVKQVTHSLTDGSGFTTALQMESAP